MRYCRCYNPEYYGSEDAEGTTGDQLIDKKGRALFMRAIFPGLPFLSMSTIHAFSYDWPCTCAIVGADNEYRDEQNTEPRDVCTPSLKNDAAAGHTSVIVALVALIISTIVACA
jgi:hypothetical protein